MGKESGGSVSWYSRLEHRLNSQIQQLEDADRLLGGYSDNIGSFGFQPVDSTNLYISLKSNEDYEKYYLIVSDFAIALYKDSQSDWRNDTQIFSYSWDDEDKAFEAFQEWVARYGINTTWRVKKGIVEEKQHTRHHHEWTTICSVAHLEKLAADIHFELQLALPFAGIGPGVGK